MKHLMPTSGVGSMLIYPRTTGARVLSALFDLLVGLRLLLPDHIFDAQVNPGYRLLAIHFRGDVPLGLVLAVSGAVQIYALYRDNMLKATTFSIWFCFLTWLLVAIDIFLVNVTQIGTFVYFLVAALHAWAYYDILQWQRQLNGGLVAAKPKRTQK